MSIFTILMAIKPGRMSVNRMPTDPLDKSDTLVDRVVESIGLQRWTLLL